MMGQERDRAAFPELLRTAGPFSLDRLHVRCPDAAYGSRSGTAAVGMGHFGLG